MWFLNRLVNTVTLSFGRFYEKHNSGGYVYL